MNFKKELDKKIIDELGKSMEEVIKEIDEQIKGDQALYELVKAMHLTEDGQKARNQYFSKLEKLKRQKEMLVSISGLTDLIDSMEKSEKKVADLSIINETDWFVVVLKSGQRWLAKGSIVKRTSAENKY